MKSTPSFILITTTAAFGLHLPAMTILDDSYSQDCFLLMNEFIMFGLQFLITRWFILMLLFHFVSQATWFDIFFCSGFCNIIYLNIKWKPNNYGIQNVMKMLSSHHKHTKWELCEGMDVLTNLSAITILQYIHILISMRTLNLHNATQ